MKIAIYSPYLDTAGGGEKYILTVAECLSKENELDVLLDDHLLEIGIDTVKLKIEKLHGLDLSSVNFVKAPIGKGGNFLDRLFFLRKYDWLFFLTDGSIFWSSAKNSAVHFQVPFSNAPSGVWGRMKQMSWDIAVYNSDFTKSIVEKSWRIKGRVIYPPVSVKKLVSLTKKKQILSVGRFFGFLKDKKHEFLIDSFKKIVDKNNLKDWSLHLVGGAGEGDMEYVEQLKKQAVGYEVYFYPNAQIEQVGKLYGESAIYWHAAGFGEEDPKKFEHFGIVVVEAMAAGCIPVVINKGGLREIVDNQINGFLWNDSEELERFTLEVIKNPKKVDEMKKLGQEKAQEFSKDRFIKSIKELVYGQK